MPHVTFQVIPYDVGAHPADMAAEGPGEARVQSDGVTGDHMPNHCSAP
jgi:hypothetical protein